MPKITIGQNQIRDIEEASKLYRNVKRYFTRLTDERILPSNKQFIDFIRNTFENTTQIKLDKRKSWR